MQNLQLPIGLLVLTFCSMIDQNMQDVQLPVGLLGLNLGSMFS
jgi:hypothetical protein